MITIQNVYRSIKKTKHLSNIDIDLEISDEQKASLFCLSLLYKKTDDGVLRSKLLMISDWLSKYENIIDNEIKNDITSLILSMIMQKVTGNPSFDASDIGEKIISSRIAEKNLKKLFLAHNVKQKTINDIFDKSFADVIGLKKVDMDILSDENFIFRGINQRKVGDLVNFEMGAAKYEFGVNEKTTNGVLLYHRPGDRIKKGEAIFSIYSTIPKNILYKKENIVQTLKNSIIF